MGCLGGPQKDAQVSQGVREGSLAEVTSELSERISKQGQYSSHGEQRVWKWWQSRWGETKAFLRLILESRV